MAKSKDAFKGFTPEAFEFLSKLSENNNKTWFDAHRGVYDAAIVAPALLFVESMALALKAIAPSVKSEPRIGGSLFRIHRDTRFSADKSPYKAHVGIRFRDADTASSSKCTGPLFYVEFDATRLRLGIGVKEFGSNTLQSYRRAVARKEAADEITGIIRRAHRGGHAVLGDVLARIPTSYSSQADNELLRRKGLFIVRETGLPNEIYRPDFVAFCMRSFEPQAPLFDRLRRIALGRAQ